MDGLDELRERYPGWSIEPVWVARATGPDCRAFVAQRDGVTIRAVTPDALAEKIKAAEHAA